MKYLIPHFLQLKTFWAITPSRLRRLSIILIPVAFIYSIAELWIVAGFILLAKFVLESGLTSDQNINNKTPVFASSNYLDIQNPSLILIVFACSVLIVSILRLISLNYILKWSYELSQNLCKTIMNLNLSMSLQNSFSYDNNKVLSSTISFGYPLANGFFYSLARLLVAIFQIGLLLIVLYFYAWSLLLYVGSSIFIIYMLIAMYNSVKIKANAKKLLISEASLLQIAKDSLASRRDILVYSLHDRYANEFKSRQSILRFIQRQNCYLAAYPKIAVECTFLFFLTIFVAFAIANQNVFSGNILTSLIIFAASLQKLLPATQSAYGAFAEIQSLYKPLISMINDIKSMTYESKSMVQFRPSLSGKQLVRLNGNFYYPGSSSPTLKNLDLVISEADKILIKGPSGSGKSTLVDLLMGLLETDIPTSISSRLVSHDGFYSAISHVPQSPVFYTGTVLDNITLGRYSSSSELSSDELSFLEKILEISMVDFLVPLEIGLEEIISDSSSGFSGGQLQRLSIARSLYHEAEIYILDEATSALDNNTEAKLVKKLINYLNGKTAIIISHSNAFDPYVNKIFNIKNKEVFENPAVTKFQSHY